MKKFCFGQSRGMASCHMCPDKALCVAESNSATKHEPEPVGNGQIIIDLVEKDLRDRAEVGKEKYGTYLRANNGRNSLMDAYQEVLDLAMYLRQLIYEKDGK